ncbi:MAG TPA: hypothetical protein VFS24_13325 [Steroidobacteraceae bacterium]|nr:hypothetical protein [Steroidobacteraceae bacterium]
MTDDEFLDAFTTCTLLPQQFNHRAHVRVAWLMLRRYPVDQAIERTCEGIARLAAHFGAADKFNRTLSEALVRLMARACESTRDASFDEFLGANEWLLQDVRGALAEYYSPALLYSVDTKQQFLAPDLKPLP